MITVNVGRTDKIKVKFRDKYPRKMKKLLKKGVQKLYKKRTPSPWDTIDIVKAGHFICRLGYLPFQPVFTLQTI